MDEVCKHLISRVLRLLWSLDGHLRLAVHAAAAAAAAQRRVPTQASVERSSAPASGRGRCSTLRAPLRRGPRLRLRRLLQWLWLRLRLWHWRWLPLLLWRRQRGAFHLAVHIHFHVSRMSCTPLHSTPLITQQPMLHPRQALRIGMLAIASRMPHCQTAG